MLLDYLITIIEEFCKDYNIKLTGSYIAKKKKLNQKTVSNYLNELENKGILKSKTDGRNKYYFLNLENKEIVKNFIIAIEHLRTIKFYTKNPLIKEIVEKILPYINGIAIVFGSYARGNQKEDSDLDILIIGNAKEDKINEIGEMYNKEINLKIYEKFKKDILMKEVLKNHIITKNVEKFVSLLIK